MIWDWDYARSILPELMLGVWYTLIVTVCSSVIALIGGLALAIVEQAAGRAGRLMVGVILEIVRGVPILVLLFFGFYVLPEYGLVFPALPIGIAVLGIVYAACCSEVYRGSLESIPQSLREASTALSLSSYTRWRGVIIPLMLKRWAPALANYVLTIIRQTSFLFAIGIPMLMGKASTLSFQSFKYLEPVTMAGLFYFALNLPFIFLFSRFKTDTQ